MKKLLIVLLLIYKSTLFGQTVLASIALDLKRTDENNQVLNVENTVNHDVFVFAANDQNVTILKYNSALFLNDQFTFPITNLEKRLLIGYGFGDDGNPNLYWASDDFKDLIVVKYYLQSRSQKMLKFNFPFSTHDIITFFQKNNIFCILSKDKKEQTLTLYSFVNGMAEEKVFDFSSFKFQNRNTQFVTFNKIIEDNEIEEIDTENFTPLDKSTKKSKVYMLDNHLILTLDHNPKKTQVFDLNIENHTVTEKSFNQSTISGSRKISNSFYLDNKLYQINANKDELIFDIKDYESGETIKNIKVGKNDTIKFKTSPLLIQTDGGKPTELKKTLQFLSHLSSLDIGLSAFKNQHNTLVTIGGSPNSENLYQFYDTDFGPIARNINVYFESTLNNKFEFIQEQQQPLAIDNIYYFLSLQKKAAFQNIFKFKDYYILGYYDTGSRQYIMRKFTDGFMPPEISNPIIDKAIFSQPFPLKKP